MNVYDSQVISLDEAREQRKKANKFYKQVLKKAKETGTEKKVIRRLAKEDRFFLLVYVLGRDDCNTDEDERGRIGDWVFRQCRMVEKNPDGYLDLWAREHFKSSLITTAGVIQRHINNPEETIAIFSFNRPIAKAFFRQIKIYYETCVKLKWAFSEIFWDDPKSQAPKWSEDDGLILKRKGNQKEASLEAWGLIDGQPTSKHFTGRVYNDIVTEDTVRTADMIQKATKAWELSLNLGTVTGWEWYEGTIYDYNDTYSEIIKRQHVIPRIFPGTKDGKPGGEPAMWTKEILAKKRQSMGAKTFACQILLDPKLDLVNGFDEEWILYWPSRHWRNMNTYLFVDPANKKKKKSDFTVIFVIGIGSDGNTYVVDFYRDKWNLEERTDKVFELHRKYRPLAVYYEQYGKDSDIEHFEYVMKHENYRFMITPVGGKMSKEDRIESLIPNFKRGSIYFPEDCVHRNYENDKVDLVRAFLYDEYIPYPFVKGHDDLLDCLARINSPEVSMRTPDTDLFDGHLADDNDDEAGYNILEAR